MGIRINTKKADIKLKTLRTSNQAWFEQSDHKDEDKSMQRWSAIIFEGGVYDMLGVHSIGIKTDDELETASYIEINFTLAQNANDIKYKHTFFAIMDGALHIQCFLDSAAFIALVNSVHFKEGVIDLEFMRKAPDSPHDWALGAKQKIHPVESPDEILFDFSGKERKDYWLDVECYFKTPPKDDKYASDQERREFINEHLEYIAKQVTKNNSQITFAIWSIIIILGILIIIF
ncbi:MAG: hypothetical protein Q4B88_06050 [Moraxella sp.]|nr:hypothetical protein [Moraxella sp.]